MSTQFKLKWTIILILCVMAFVVGFSGGVAQGKDLVKDTVYKQYKTDALIQPRISE